MRYVSDCWSSLWTIWYIYQYGEHIAWRLALHVDAVHLDDLVAHVYQARSICCAAVHNSSYNYFARLLIRFYGCALKVGNDIFINTA